MIISYGCPSLVFQLHRLSKVLVNKALENKGLESTLSNKVLET